MRYSSGQFRFSLVNNKKILKQCLINSFLQGFSDDESNYPAKIENLPKKIVAAIDEAKSSAKSSMKKFIPDLDHFLTEPDQSSFSQITINSDMGMEEEEEEEEEAQEDVELEAQEFTQETINDEDEDDFRSELDSSTDDFQSDSEEEVQTPAGPTASNETASSINVDLGDKDPPPHFVKGKDGRMYPISELVFKYYGYKHSIRQHSRQNRFFSNEPYHSLTNDPRGFGAEAAVLENCSLARNDFVLLACEGTKKRSKGLVVVAKIMWFVNYYHSKGKKQGEAKAIANTMEDNVLVKCFCVRKNGEIQAAKIHFKLVPLKKICDSRYKVQVEGNKICGFSKTRFQTLRKALLEDLSTDHNHMKEMQKAKKQTRVDDMTCPLSSMTRNEVWEECKRRMKENDNTLRPSLISYALLLNFPVSEAEKLFSPTLKRILRHLRDNSIGSAGDSGDSVGGGGGKGGEVIQ